ncbi:hypothetical protein IFM89_030344 [Coptis chinensis]|uniref:Oxidoreductase molybdopterin-binding domain-containing protein n=1 Tax=Coptis chinensis TaxID=261450 RepID=A0A835IHI1_9MAGN|nr:hypothetical protein IFM89_030344 [Coptis chinensis]
MVGKQLPCFYLWFAGKCQRIIYGGYQMGDVFLNFSHRKLPKYEVTATLQCAGNKRTPMSKTKTVKGVGWGVSAIGTGVYIYWIPTYFSNIMMK